jgi:acyl-CoA thioester hydrolase
MNGFEDKLWLRVRYSETDQMGTFYNSRVLEWFECARSEIMRKLGIPYVEMEARGFFLPLIEAHVAYQGRARYDDLLELTTRVAFEGRARLRCEVTIVQAESRRPVASGHTIHAFTTHEGRPQRPPAWFIGLVEGKLTAPPPLRA